MILIVFVNNEAVQKVEILSLLYFQSAVILIT